MGTADGRVGVALRRSRGKRRRGSGGGLVASVDGVVESQSGQSIGESLVGVLLLLRRVKPEAQLDTRFELVEVFVRDALAPLLLLLLLLPAVAFAAVPRLVAVGVRGPRLVLVERHGRHDHRRGGGRWQRVGFRHLARPPPRAWGFAEVGGPRARAAWERWLVWNYLFSFGRREGFNRKGKEEAVGPSGDFALVGPRHHYLFPSLLVFLFLLGILVYSELICLFA